MLGAFVAGLNGGLIYNNFPMMGDGFVPEEIYQIDFKMYLYNPSIVQFFHRISAYILCLVIIIFSYKAINLATINLSKTIYHLLLALIFQISLGIITLIYSVPLLFALLHQFGAILLLSAMMRAYYLMQTANI